MGHILSLMQKGFMGVFVIALFAMVGKPSLAIKDDEKETFPFMKLPRDLQKMIVSYDGVAKPARVLSKQLKNVVAEQKGVTLTDSKQVKEFFSELDVQAQRKQPLPQEPFLTLFVDDHSWVNDVRRDLEYKRNYYGGQHLNLVKKINLIFSASWNELKNIELLLPQLPEHTQLSFPFDIKELDDFLSRMETQPKQAKKITGLDIWGCLGEQRLTEQQLTKIKHLFPFLDALEAWVREDAMHVLKELPLMRSANMRLHKLSQPAAKFSFDVLSSWPNIENLAIGYDYGGTTLTQNEMSNLEVCKKLKRFSTYAIEDGSVLSHLPDLRDLNLMVVYKENFKWLNKLQSLRSLRMGELKGALGELAPLTSLETLSLRIIPLWDYKTLAGIEKLTNLKELSIWSTDAVNENFNPIGELKSLTSLSIDLTEKDELNIGFVKDLSRLKFLRLRGKIIDSSGILDKLKETGCELRINSN